MKACYNNLYISYAAFDRQTHHKRDAGNNSPYKETLFISFANIAEKE